MLSSDSNIETIGQLVEEIKKYVSLRAEYLKLDVAEKAVKVVATIIVICLLTTLALFILGFLSITLAFALSPVMGKTAAFALIAAIYLLLFVLCIAFRKKWIEAPLVRFFASLFFE